MRTKEWRRSVEMVRPQRPRTRSGRGRCGLGPMKAVDQANTFQERAVRVPKICGFCGSWLVGRKPGVIFLNQS